MVITTPIESPESIVPAATTTTTTTKSNDYILSEWLMPSYVFVYICHGEFAAFIIAWNLIMEYVVCMALVAKGLVCFFDEIAFSSMEFSLQHLVPMQWTFSDHFDLVAFFVPIMIGGKILLLFSMPQKKKMLENKYFSM